ncbi:MAG: hypothetical protein JM58_14585 [Peptococcaceae bacterium BICA1-8]|nr:MAG: hypothetical protein JM58_14585 [Peptococcaceae bacterium BICA1-8]
MEPTTRYLSTLERALWLLTFFDSGSPKWRVSDLSRQTGISKSTVSRMLQTMEKHDFIEKDIVTGQYGLGVRFLEFAALVSYGQDLRRCSQNEMSWLVNETGECVILTVHSAGEAICIDKRDSSRPVHITYLVGGRASLHAGASGKILAAFMNPTDIEQFIKEKGLARYTDKTIVDPDEFRQDLERIRQQGYAITHGELDSGIMAVAAPIFNNECQIVGGISVVCLPERLNEALDEIVEKTIKAANRISLKLGFSNESTKQYNK